MTHAALAVLGDASLLALVASFQRGLPRDLALLARTLALARVDGALHRLAVRRGDDALLRRLFRLARDQHAELRCVAFDGVWLDALREGRVAMAQWMLQQPAIPTDHDELATLQAACASGSVALVAWLLETRPQLRDQFSAAAVACCSSVALIQWLESHVPELPCSTELMDRAATDGRLEIVQYLHAHRSEGCTTDAMDGAAANGHVEVVRFLHENRREGATPMALVGAAERGHFEVVKYLYEHRIAECGVLPITKAALHGHDHIVQYLHMRLPPTLAGLRSKKCHGGWRLRATAAS